MNAKIHSLSIFFPCYNDAGTIASMVILANRVAREFTEDYEIIVVDDGSRDGSREVLDELQSILPDRIKLVLHDKNRGYGGALRSGFATASKEWVFYTDGDAQYDPRELRELIKKVSEEVDVVQGYKIKRHDPWYRILIGELYRLSMKVLFSLKIRDVDCDFRLIRRSVLQKFHLTQDSGVICLELVKKLHMAGARFTEVGVTHHFRAYGHSQFFNFGRIARVGIGVLKLWWELVIRREGV
ncbi:MAG: glycosyltransferase family 2 protein [Candidatus Hydrogenedentota bacterium]|nr:MAG: glycosyltransferase family 2 protein [Candidatus Hydrogenedentota bacterium]GIX44826.1 MAG: glycosyl transferase [Candidatus Sumerlaea sp.]